MAIDNDNHRRTMMLNGFLDIIAAAQTDHSNEPRMVHWCGRAKIVLQRFDGPTHSFESVMSELEELGLVGLGEDDLPYLEAVEQVHVNLYHTSNAGASLLEDGNTFHGTPGIDTATEANGTGGHEEKEESYAATDMYADDGEDDYMPEESQYYMSPGGTFHEPDSENDIDQDEIEI